MANKDSRIKNNLISSIVSQIVLISLGFLIPRLYLENFGSEVNGVLSTIKQIFAYMTILEAGIGLASEQALYKKIGLKDYKRASEVLAATNIYYKKTGVAYMVFNNTDIILISSLCDFKAASVYSIYNLFFFQVQNFIVNLSSSYNFALGQMFNIDREKFDKVFNVYETLYIME